MTINDNLKSYDLKSHPTLPTGGSH